ncbi:MAG: hypothetical protein SFZ23_02040 [Planctomycetota bacterium]|nr:hypothetical protein [Planctomycetota bacterium]
MFRLAQRAGNNRLVFERGRIVDGCVRGLMDEQARLRADRSPRGIDALPEVSLHAILAQGLLSEGFGVSREWPYPLAQPTSARSRAERQRCDLLLTPDPSWLPHDEQPPGPLPSPDAAPSSVTKRTRGKASAKSRGRSDQSLPLFGREHIELVEVESTADGVHELRAEECFWLEVKLVSQFTYTRGVPEANRTYGAELSRGVRTDVAKLAASERVCFAGLLLVLLARDAATASHDLATCLVRASDRGDAFRAPEVRSFEIDDRVGNAAGVACLIPK